MMKKPIDLKNYNMKTIVIIGHMGSGKSLVGKLLSRKINWNYFDSDEEIEKDLNFSIVDIFKTHGESYFRKKEELIIEKLIKKKYSVISLGGGSITIKKIRSLLEKKTISIFLKVDIDILAKRLKNSKKRPLLINANIKNKIFLLNKERLPFYNNANIVVENSKSIKKTVNDIIKILI